MGVDVTRFIGQIHGEFHCIICLMVLEEPMQSPCDHLFCKDCIQEWLEANKNCPADCGLLNTDDLKPAPRYVRNILNGFDIKCDFQQNGCQAVVVLEDLHDHIANCEYNPKAEIVCDKGCNLKMTRREYQTYHCRTHQVLSLLTEQQMQFDNLVKGLEEDNTKLREEKTFLSDENERLVREVNTLEEENTKLKEKLNLRNTCVHAQKYHVLAELMKKREK